MHTGNTALTDAVTDAVTDAIPPFGAPAPLPAGRPPLPPFDLDLLPAPLRDFAADVAARAGSPPAVPAVGLTVALGAVVGRHVGIRPRAGDPRVTVANPWGALVAEGEAFTDSGALAEATGPLERLEWRAHEDFVRDDAYHRARLDAYRVARTVWRERVRRAAREGQDPAALAALHPPEPAPPAVRRYRTATGTPRNLVRLLTAHAGGLLLEAGDLAAWVRHRAGPGREGERRFLLACADGNAPGVDLDLPDGTGLHCPHPCLSVLGWLTADARARLLAPGIPAAGAHELLARFPLTYLLDGPREPAEPDRPAEAGPRDRAVAVFETLDQALRGRPHGAGIHALGFEAEAQGFADLWQAERARRLAGTVPDGLALALAAQGEAMPALALLLHLAEGVEAGRGEAPVSLWAARRAAVWCDQLEAHARRLHGAEAPAEVGGARLLLERLLAGELPRPFTLRDVYRRHWTGLASRDRAREAVRVLERHGYLAAEPVPTTARGGKPTRVYHLNPRAGEAAEGSA